MEFEKGVKWPFLVGFSVMAQTSNGLLYYEQHCPRRDVRICWRGRRGSLRVDHSTTSGRRSKKTSNYFQSHRPKRWAGLWENLSANVLVHNFETCTFVFIKRKTYIIPKEPLNDLAKSPRWTHFQHAEVLLGNVIYVDLCLIKSILLSPIFFVHSDFRIWCLAAYPLAYSWLSHQNAGVDAVTPAPSFNQVFTPCCPPISTGSFIQSIHLSRAE